MQAGDQGPGGAAGGDEGHGTPGDSGGPDGPAGHEDTGRGDEGEAGAAAPTPGGNTVPGPGAQAASERSGQAGPAAGGPGRQLLQYFLRVRFPTATAANLARRAMTPPVVQQQEAVRMEFRVLRNVLSVRLTAEDPVQLEMCVISCIDKLAILVCIMQRFVPPSNSAFYPGRGA